MIPRLTGQQFQLLQEALLDAFPTITALREMVRFHLEMTLEVAGNRRDTIYQLIEDMNAHGRIEELVVAALKSNGGNPKLQQIATQLFFSARSAAEPHPTDNPAEQEASSQDGTRTDAAAPSEPEPPLSASDEVAPVQPPAEEISATPAENGVAAEEETPRVMPAWVEQLTDMHLQTLEYALRSDETYWHTAGLTPPKWDSSYTQMYFSNQATRIQHLHDNVGAFYHELKEANFRSSKFIEDADDLLNQLDRQNAQASSQVSTVFSIVPDHSLSSLLEENFQLVAQNIEELHSAVRQAASKTTTDRESVKSQRQRLRTIAQTLMRTLNLLHKWLEEI